MPRQTICEEWPLILGSASPRRRAILRDLGIPIHVVPADVEERQRPRDTPESFLERIVDDKLAAVQQRLWGEHEEPSPLLVADTVVLIDGQILGKPEDTQDALRLLGKLAGRTHEVRTRYALCVSPHSKAQRTVCSKVSMRAANHDELSAYAQTGEGLDKAGAYAVQGIGAFLVERIDGSYTNVVGLPACEVIVDLKRLGLLDRYPI